MQIIVGRKIPEQRLAMQESVVAKKEIVSLLPLSIEERIIVISLETLDHIPRMT